MQLLRNLRSCMQRALDGVDSVTAVAMKKLERGNSKA